MTNNTDKSKALVVANDAADDAMDSLLPKEDPPRIRVIDFIFKIFGDNLPDAAQEYLRRMIPGDNDARLQRVYQALKDEETEEVKQKMLSDRLREAIAQLLIPKEQSELWHDNLLRLLTKISDQTAESTNEATKRHEELVGLFIQVLIAIRDTRKAAESTTSAVKIIFEGPGGSPIREVPNFTGREEQLTQLEGIFGSGSISKEDIGVVVIMGTGGLGKTSLAMQFVATKGKELFPGGVYWLRGGTLEEDVARVATQLGWTKDLQMNPGAYVQRELSRRQGESTNEPFLLVMDDLSLGQISEMEDLPLINGATLITSRDRLSSSLEAKTQILDLEVWTPEQSVKYLKAASNNCKNETNGDLAQLARFVGHLPLGVRLVAKLMETEPRRTAQNLYQHLTAIELGALAELDSIAVGQVRGIEKSFIANWEILNPKDKSVLIALSACYGEVSFATLRAISDLDENELRLSLRELVRASLVDYNEETECYSLHDVIRLFASAQSEEEMSVERNNIHWRHVEWVNNSLDDEKGGPFSEAVRQCRGVAKNALIALREVDGGKNKMEVTDETIELANTPLIEIYSKLINTGKYYQTALRVAEDFLVCISDEMPELKAVWLKGKAACQRELSDFDAAIKSINRAIELTKGDPVSERHDLTSLHLEEAEILWCLHRYPESLGAANKAIEIEKSNSNGNPENLAKAYGKAGVALSRMARFDEALDNAKQSLLIRGTICSGETLSLAEGYVDIAYIYAKMGQFTIALNYNLEALKIYSTLLGENHPKLIHRYHRIATIYRKMNNFEESIHYLKKAIDLAEIAPEENLLILKNLYFEMVNFTVDPNVHIRYWEKIDGVDRRINPSALFTQVGRMFTAYKMAMIYEQIEEIDKALDSHKKVIQFLLSIQVKLPSIDLEEVIKFISENEEFVNRAIIKWKLNPRHYFETALVVPGDSYEDRSTDTHYKIEIIKTVTYENIRRLLQAFNKTKAEAFIQELLNILEGYF